MFALAFMFLGMLAGFLLRRRLLSGLIARLVMPLILALLFCMGVLIGGNAALMDALPTLGALGLAIAAASLAGSVLAVSLLARLFPSLLPGRKDGGGP